MARPLGFVPAEGAAHPKAPVSTAKHDRRRSSGYKWLQHMPNHARPGLHDDPNTGSAVGAMRGRPANWRQLRATIAGWGYDSRFCCC